MLNTPFSPWPSFTQEEAEAIQHVLLSNKVNYWTGQEGREFEKEFAAYIGTDYAVAIANGTLALDVAFKALDIGEGDEVIVSVMEHHSNIVPWQLLAARKGIAIKVIPMNDKGELLLEEYENLFSEVR